MGNATIKLKPLASTNLLEASIESLEKAILQGELKPGDSLPAEAELAESLSVSRTIVREAMRVLQARGLVEVAQGRRPRVRGGDPDAVSATLNVLLQQGDHSLLELVEARRGLEGEVAMLAAERATDDQIELLREAIEQLQLAKGDISAMVEADLRFHQLLIECTGNVVFRVLLSPLMKLLKASLRKTLSFAGADVAASGHEAILKAIKRRSPSGARKAMLEHLQQAESHIREEVGS